MEDFSSTVEHLELPRQHVHFDRNRKRAKPSKKGRESLIWFCSHFQFQERVLFAPFWSSKCSNRPCSGFLALQGSLKCHGIAVKTTTMAVVHLPKSLENRSMTTPLVGIPDRPCLRWTSRNVFFVTQRKKNEKLPKPWGTYPLYLGVFPNNSAQRCSNINDARILMRISLKRRRVLLEIDQLTGLHAKEVMYHASSYRKYTSPKSLDSVAIIQRLSPMTATRHGLQMSYLNEQVLSCWVVIMIPIPLPQHQHTFCQRRRVLP